MDLDSIIKLVRENKLNLEDKSILKSKEFEEYIKIISKKLYEKHNLSFYSFINKNNLIDIILYVNIYLYMYIILELKILMLN